MATVILSLGSPQDAAVLADHYRYKRDSGLIQSFVAFPDSSTGELTISDPGRFARTLKGPVKKILVVGHSSPYGHTLQGDQVPGANAPLGQRVRHYADVAGFIASHLDRSQFSAAAPLKISLLSCYGGIGDDQALGAKIQREFERVHQIPCEVNARNGLVFIQNPCYVIRPGEYAMGLVAQHFKCSGPKQEFYSIPPERQRFYHKARGTKVTFYTDPFTGEQRSRDAYAYNRKVIQQLKDLCGQLKAELRDEKSQSCIARIEESVASMDVSDPKVITSSLLPLLFSLKKKCLGGSGSFHEIERMIQYIQTHMSAAKAEKTIAAPMSERDARTHKTHSQIVEAKCRPLEAKLHEIRESHPEMYTAFLEPRTGILAVVKTYYYYQLKHGLKTRHVDQLLDKLTLLASRTTSRAIAHPVLLLESPEAKAVHDLLEEIVADSTLEGAQRAYDRGFLYGSPHFQELVSASRSKRETLCDGIKKKLSPLNCIIGKPQV